MSQNHYSPAALCSVINSGRIRVPLSHSHALEAIAALEGAREWNSVAQLPHSRLLKARAKALRSHINSLPLSGPLSETEAEAAIKVVLSAEASPAPHVLPALPTFDDPRLDKTTAELFLQVLLFDGDAGEYMRKRGFWPTSPTIDEIADPSPAFKEAACAYALSQDRKVGSTWISPSFSTPAGLLEAVVAAHPSAERLSRVSCYMDDGVAIISAYVDVAGEVSAKPESERYRARAAQYFKGNAGAFPTELPSLPWPVRISYYPKLPSVQADPLRLRLEIAQLAFYQACNQLSWLRLATVESPPRWAAKLAKSRIEWCSDLDDDGPYGDLCDRDCAVYAVHAIVSGLVNEAVPLWLHAKIKVALLDEDGGALFDGLHPAFPVRPRKGDEADAVPSRMIKTLDGAYEFPDPQHRLDQAIKVVVAVIKPMIPLIEENIEENMSKLTFE